MGRSGWTRSSLGCRVGVLCPPSYIMHINAKGMPPETAIFGDAERRNETKIRRKLGDRQKTMKIIQQRNE